MVHVVEHPDVACRGPHRNEGKLVAGDAETGAYHFRIDPNAGGVVLRDPERLANGQSPV